MGNGFIIPLSIQDRLTRSKLVTLFSYQARAIGDYYYDLDMEGYAKAILLLSPIYNDKPISATLVSNTGFCDLSNPNNMIDGNLSTYATIDPACAGYGGSCDMVFKVTWANNSSRVLSYNATHDLTHDVTVSQDDITYIAWTPSIAQTFKYAKFHLTYTMPPSGSWTTMHMNEIFNANIFGGTATISFTAIDPSSSQYVDVIKGSDIGAVTSGSPIAVQMGDTLAQTNLNRAMPTLFSGWRVHLAITNASLGIGISLIKIK